jgi:ATPase
MVSKQNIPSIIGRGGSTINDLEKMLKVHIDVAEKELSDIPSYGSSLAFDFSESRTALLLNVGKEKSGLHADIYVNDDYITSSRIGRKGQIKIPKRSNPAKKIMKGASSKEDIKIFLKD